MAKLYFRYGTMGSSKTLNLLAVAHNYSATGMRPLVISPAVDTRGGVGTISSRAGLQMEADLCISPDQRIRTWDLVAAGIPDCVLVDEAQFLTEDQVDDLRWATVDPGVPVICYGLRTDSNGTAFPGSLRLLEIADTIEEVKTICAHETCGRKAVMTLRTDRDGNPVFGAAQVEIGDEQYSAVCWEHWHDEVGTLSQQYQRSRRYIRAVNTPSDLRQNLTKLEGRMGGDFEETIRTVSIASEIPEASLLAFRAGTAMLSTDERQRLCLALAGVLNTRIETDSHVSTTASSIRERIAELETGLSSRAEFNEMVRALSQRSDVSEYTIRAIRGCVMSGTFDERARLDAALTSMLDARKSRDADPGSEVGCDSLDCDYWAHTGTCE